MRCAPASLIGLKSETNVPLLKYNVQDVRLGALYRIGAARRFDRETLVRLMVERARMTPDKARQLAGHWLTTERYRTQRIPPPPY